MRRMTKLKRTWIDELRQYWADYLWITIIVSIISLALYGNLYSGWATNKCTSNGWEPMVPHHRIVTHCVRVHNSNTEVIAATELP